MSDKVNILLVDDQPAKLLTYETMLANENWNLIKVGSGREALSQLLKMDVALIVADISMPDMDGFELAAIVRKHPRFHETAIIFVSAVHMGDADRLQGYKHGAVDYVSVPVVPGILHAKVNVFVELHKKTRQLERLNHELEQRVLERTAALQESGLRIRDLNRELRERVTELETVMQVLPFGVLVAHDPQCEIVTCNAAFRKLIGECEKALDADESHIEFYKDARRLNAEELPIRQAAAGLAVAGTELEIRRTDGSLAYVLVSANPLRDEEGQVLGAVAAYFDITSRKQMESTLKQKADLLELASEAILVRDLEGAIHFWNAGAEALYGWESSEVVGRKENQILKSRFTELQADIQKALEVSGRWSGTLVQRTKDGREITVASRQALAKEDLRGLSVILEINRDITEQLQVEEALRRAEQFAAMGRIAGTIAHEINNPLEAITNAIYLLQGQPSLDDEARRYAYVANQELLRLGHIVKQTLGFYRQSRKSVPVLLSNLLDEVLEIQALSMKEHRITVRKNYRTDKTILGFPSELKQVLLNLISNAIDAMPEGGRLGVNLYDSVERRTGRWGIRVSICDTGSGILHADADKIFEPFFTTKAEKGTGLGLWISKGIVQKHGGAISARTLRLSRGSVTCFMMFFPGSDSANVAKAG